MEDPLGEPMVDVTLDSFITYISLRYIDTYVTCIYIYIFYSDHDSLFLIDTP